MFESVRQNVLNPKHCLCILSTILINGEFMPRLVNRPSVAGAVLHKPLLLIN